MVQIKIETAFIFGLFAATQWSQGEAAVTSITLPKTDGDLRHGLCVLGAADAKATSRGNTYTSMPMKEDVPIWGRYKHLFMHGIEGNGAEVCEGGTYLQPLQLGPPSGTEIRMEATPVDEQAGVTFCVIIEQPWMQNGKLINRSGNLEQPLMDEGFTPSENKLTIHVWPQLFTSYCKHVPPPTSYTFPTTQYDKYDKEHPFDGGMFHGLCVLGAADAKATVKGSDFSYTSMPMKDGMHMWGDYSKWMTYTVTGIKGNGDEVCEHGTYLQPSKHFGPPSGVDVTLEATPVDESAGVTFCAIIEQPFQIGNKGHLFNRSGNWEQPLMDDGFTPFTNELKVGKWTHSYKNYCKHFPPPTEPPSNPPETAFVPSEAAVTSYTFPSPEYDKYNSNPNIKHDGGLFHGLCVLGAANAKANVKGSDFFYTSSLMEEGVQVWNDRPWKFSGIEGNGAEVCEGGTYLKPSRHFGPPSGHDVTLEATPVDESAGVTFCAIIEEPFIQPRSNLHFNRSGNWGKPLMDDGFTPSKNQLKVHDWLRPYTSYCKHFPPVTRYTFPETQYEEYNSNKQYPHDGGMFHGLCVLGAANAKANVKGSDFFYTSMPMTEGVQAWGNNKQWKFFGIEGNGPEVCEGGTYLQPSKYFGPPSGVDITLEATPVDESAGVTFCAIIAQPFELNNGHLYNRSGNWEQPMMDDGFTPSKNQLKIIGRWKLPYTSYCKHFPPPTVAAAESPTPLRTYAFPETKYVEPQDDPRQYSGGMAHGLCVLGAEDVSTTISPNPNSFSYKKIPDFKDGVKTWGDRPANIKFSGINGHGDEVCEGGIYLQPSSIHGPASGVDVTVEAIAKDRNTDVVLCTFLEDSFSSNVEREGNWKQPLLDDGFIPSDRKISYLKGRTMTIYCKSLPEPTNAATESPTFEMILDGTGKKLEDSCQGDIRLKHTYGSTAFPTSAVTILSQDTKTVTVALNQAWDAPVDKYFYSFQESTFSNHCYEEEGFAPGQSLPPITIQCLVTSPLASVRICLQDTGGGLLSKADDAIVSNCCLSDAPEGTPTVCYNVDIMCETTCVSEESRMLRGRII